MGLLLESDNVIAPFYLVEKIYANPAVIGSAMAFEMLPHVSILLYEYCLGAPSFRSIWGSDLGFPGPDVQSPYPFMQMHWA